MIVGEKTKRINYEKAKKILDQQRIEEKQEKMKQKKSTLQNDDIQERREPHPTKEQLKEDLIGV